MHLLYVHIPALSLQQIFMINASQRLVFARCDNNYLPSVFVMVKAIWQWYHA